MVYLNENVVRDVWLMVWERTKQENVTITAYTYHVTNEAGTIVQLSAPASLKDNGTTLVYIFGSVDTTVSGFVLGNFYDVHFYYTIGTEAPIHDIVRLRYENRPMT